METYQTIKIQCLVCNEILEADPINTDVNFAECSCDNHVELINIFRWSEPFSTIRAADKTKVKAQAIDDLRWAKKGEWFFVRPPEDENTPKYKKWMGQTKTGRLVVFETEDKITPNACRQLLKLREIIDLPTGERIYHFWQEYDASIYRKFGTDT